MKVLYTILVQTVIPVFKGTKDIIIDGVNVNWKITKDENLEAVILQFTGADLLTDDDGIMTTEYPELDVKAFKIANYLSNRILLETGLEAFNPLIVMAGNPQILPETPIEKSKYEKLKFHVRSIFSTIRHVTTSFKPVGYPEGLQHSAPYAYYTDSLRVTHLFQKFELLYKVIEYYYPMQGRNRDELVTKYVQKFDVSFSIDVIRNLRLIRNRITHPHATGGPLRPDDLTNIKDVQARMEKMQKLAKLLLDKPPV